MRGQLSVVLCFAFVLLGCEEDVTAVLGTHSAYSMYGFFNARSDTQAVRIYAVEQRLDLVRPEKLGARVTSLDRQSGAQHVWQDSIVQFANSRYGHVFWAAFRADYGHRYTLEAVRSDDVTSLVEVTVPPLSVPELVSPTVSRGYVVLPVHWPGAPRLNGIHVVYYTNKGNFTINYPLDQRRENGGVSVEVHASRDARDVFSNVIRLGGRAAEVRLKALELFVLVSNEEWEPPTGTYDTEILIEPGVFSNVENGFGFVGAGYMASFYYEPPDSIKIAAGYLVD